jgi:purine nucleosidase
MVRLVIDTDPGVDDAHALLMAFTHPEARVEAITTVAGNVGLDKTTANACTILDVLAVDPEQTPLYAGCDRAILGGQPDAAYVHGTDGLGDGPRTPSSRPVAAEHAALALIRLANAYPGELTLVALGPLTNLALALRLDPALPEKYQRLVVMGGAIRGTGNMAERPVTEFNVYADPEAAAIVFAGWPRLTLVSWETTMLYPLTVEHLETLMSAGTPRSEFFKRITSKVHSYVRDHLGRDGVYAPDPLAMAVALEPSIVTRCETRAVTVELAGAHARGLTSVDWAGLTHRPANVDLVMEVDFERFWKLMLTSVA